MKNKLQTIISRLIAGERLILGDDELDGLCQFDESNSIRSLPNPNQVGTKDRYICWIGKAEEPKG